MLREISGGIEVGTGDQADPMQSINSHDFMHFRSEFVVFWQRLLPSYGEVADGHTSYPPDANAKKLFSAID